MSVGSAIASVILFVDAADADEVVAARDGFGNDLGDVRVDLAVAEVDVDLAELLRARPHDLVFGGDPHVDEHLFERLAAGFGGLERAV